MGLNRSISVDALRVRANPTARRWPFWRTVLWVLVGVFATTIAKACQAAEQTADDSGTEVVDSTLGQTTVGNFASFVSAQATRFGGNLATQIQIIEMPGADLKQGMAAAAEGERYAAWSNVALTRIDDDVVATEFSGDLQTFIGGADYQLTEKWLAGLALAHDRSQIDTQFNGGSIRSTSITASPYAAYRLNDMVSFDGLFGYTSGNFDQRRVFPVVAGTAITSSTDFDRWFAQVNANIVYPMKQIEHLYLAGQFGYLYAKETVDGFTESNGNVVAQKDNPLGQFRVSARAGYSVFDWAEGWVFHPYTQFRVLVEHQANRIDVGAGQVEHPNDHNEVQWSIGVDIFGGPRFSANIEAIRSFARTDFSSTTISANLRLKFDGL